MEIAIVDACGGQFGHQHGSVHIYEVTAEEWDEMRAYSLPPEETLQRLQQMEEEGDAQLKRTLTPDDVVTV